MACSTVSLSCGMRASAAGPILPCTPQDRPTVDGWQCKLTTNHTICRRRAPTWLAAAATSPPPPRHHAKYALPPFESAPAHSPRHTLRLSLNTYPWFNLYSMLGPSVHYDKPSTGGHGSAPTALYTPCSWHSTWEAPPPADQAAGMPTKANCKRILFRPGSAHWQAGPAEPAGCTLLMCSCPACCFQAR